MSKLLQLNVTANWGSTGKIAEGIGIAAMSRGWHSAIAFGRYMNPSRSQLIRVGNKKDVYLHYARHRLFDGEGLGSKRATEKLIKQIEDYAPDVIQLHNIHDHWLNYPTLFEYLETIDTPVVWTFHDCWAFTGGCSHFENAGCFKWQTGTCDGSCQQGRKAAHRQFRMREKAFSALGARLHVVCVSNWLAEYAAQSFLGHCGAEFTVINNGIDTDGAFTPSDSPKERMILGVSNVWPQYKGLADFIKLRELLPDDCRIVLVGLSKKQIQTLPEGIEGLQRTSSINDLADLYRKAAVFVNPTLNDSFPTVNLEALACGTPVITYRTGGSPEAVDSLTGLVVEKGNVSLLADAIKKVLNHDLTFAAADCRERAVNYFNKDKQFSKYIDLYEAVVKNQ